MSYHGYITILKRDYISPPEGLIYYVIMDVAVRISFLVAKEEGTSEIF